MIWVYRVLFPLLLVVLGPGYLRRMLKRGGYRRDFKHRLGYLPRLPKVAGRTRVWVQAVSVGEVRAVAPLLERWQGRGDVEVILTTTTSTGYALIAGDYGGRARFCGCFPIDFWPFSARAWRRIQPDVAVVMESELWPEHLRQARRRGVPVVLVNGRLSNRSFRRYRSAGWLARWVLGGLDRVLASSEPDAERFRALLPDTQAAGVEATGNLKFDLRVEPVLDAEARRALRAELGFAPTHPEGRPPLVLLGSSTWPGEEAALLAALRHCRNQGLDVRLLLVPRHAERREEIVAMLSAQDFPFHQRSRSPQAPAYTLIYLADTTGELVRLTQAADLAFIGKSLPPHHEGQTPIEAAALGVPVLFGPEMSNFKSVAASLIRSGAALPVPSESLLRAQVEGLLRDETRRRAMSAAGQAWHSANQGAADRTAALLEPFLRGQPTERERHGSPVS